MIAHLFDVLFHLRHPVDAGDLYQHRFIALGRAGYHAGRLLGLVHHGLQTLNVQDKALRGLIAFGIILFDPAGNGDGLGNRGRVPITDFQHKLAFHGVKVGRGRLPYGAVVLVHAV